MRLHGINTSFQIDGRNLKELFLPEYFDQVCAIAQNIVHNYKTESFTHVENHEYRMACEHTKQKDKEIAVKDREIEILKLQIELNTLTRKRKVEK